MRFENREPVDFEKFKGRMLTDEEAQAFADWAFRRIQTKIATSGVDKISAALRGHTIGERPGDCVVISYDVAFTEADIAYFLRLNASL